MNTITIKGRLTRDPELRTLDSGSTVCSFGVAVDRRFKNKQTDKYDTDFFNVSAWGKTGEFVSRYFAKGQEILLMGSMQSRKKLEDDGTNHVYWDVVAENVEFCGKKGEQQAQHEPDQVGFTQVDDEELPF